MSAITVYKRNHQSEPIWHYHGTVLERNETMIVLEAVFNRDDYVATYHTFKKGDRMIEWFFADRGYNIFELHHRDTDTLEGWYCNITRPARFTDDSIHADDLALDVMVYPNGDYVILDKDEFDALPLDESARQDALAALGALLHLVNTRIPPFHQIT